MRLLLFTGKGGVGKTTAAAGTALLSADQGLKTLVLSTDGAHSLGDAFGAPIGAEPTPVAPNLAVQQVDAQLRLEESWKDVQRYLFSVLDAAGVDPITAEELTVLPGVEEVLALLELQAHAVSNAWDVIVVDCAPTAETLRLLALPEALGWYMDRVFPAERRIVSALRPVLAKASRVPMPQDSVLDAFERLHSDLNLVYRLLTGPRASIRLVLTPEQVVVAEARRSLTTLSLFGYRVDGVVANRVFPEDGCDVWRQRWVEAQRGVLLDVERTFGDLPLWRAPYRPTEPVGAEALREFARAAYGSDDPVAAPEGDNPLTLAWDGTDAVLRLALPFVDGVNVNLVRHGNELVVTVGSYRRLLSLPKSLSRHAVRSARVDGSCLTVRFRPRQQEAERTASGS